MQRSTNVHAQSFLKAERIRAIYFYHKRVSLPQEKLKLMELCLYIAAKRLTPINSATSKYVFKKTITM